MSLKLMTLNIEGNKHFERWIPVVRQRQPDALCLQEVFAVDLPEISQQLGMQYQFAVMVNCDSENKYDIPARGDWGTAIFTPQAPASMRKEYYLGSEKVMTFVEPNDASRVLMAVEMIVAGQSYIVATTHFTWTPNGKTNADQTRDLESLKKLLDSYPEIILAGDFNAPRGEEVHNQLSQWYQSQVPADVVTTIDGEFHYAGSLQLVVDDIFLSSQYRATNVEVISGLSDHKGIWAEIERS